MAKYTLTYGDRGEGGGWTSFWSYYPDLTMSLGNRFYSIKDGQLWEHYDNDNVERNNIYGKKLISKVVAILNQSNAEDKIFKNIILEGNDPWNVKIKTNLSESTLRKDEFNPRESKWFSHLRKNEMVDDFTDRLQGIGIALEELPNDKIKFSSIPTLVNVGEELYQLIDDEPVLVGEIGGISGNVISLVNVVSPIDLDAFCFVIKNARVQGSEIRGYFAEVTLTNDNVKPIELYAIGSNVVLSYAPTEIRN